MDDVFTKMLPESFRPQKPEFALIKNCGCWIVNLAQGKAVMPCARHEAAVIGVVAE